MPIIKSAQKRMRQEAHRRDRNRQVKDALHTELKALTKAVEAGNKAKAGQQLVKVQSQISRAVKKNILHQNTAARKLRRLNSLARSINTKAPTASKTTSSSTKPTPKKTTTKKA